MSRILVVAPNWIGDCVMAQPLFARLHAKLGQVRLDALARPSVAPVLRRMPEVAEVIEAPFRPGRLELKGRWRLGRQLRARAYALAIVLPNSWKSALVPFFAEIPLRAGYVGESRYALLNVVHRERGERRPEPERYAALAESPGEPPAQPLAQPRLVVREAEARATVRRFGLPERYAALCPGAEYGPAKRWPHYPALAERLDAPAVLLGSARDRPAAAAVRAIDLTGRTTLDEAIDILALAEFAVTNDSGLMHVAAALDVPLVALYGSSSPRRTPPRGARARTVWLGLPCSPCFARDCPLGHTACLRDIGPERVLAELRELRPGAH